MRKKQIFISHTSEEADFARSLKSWIQRIFDKHIDLFVSTDNGISIPLGEEWPQKIKQSLEKSSIMLVLVSHKSKDKNWIYFEAGAGYVREIPVIPICIGGITKDELPIPLKFLQAIVFPNKSNEKALFDRIIEVSKLDFPESFRKIIDSEKLELPRREIVQEKITKVSKTEKIDFIATVFESEVKLKLLDFLLDNENKFTITEMEIKSKLKPLKRRKFILKILDELQEYEYVKKSRDINQTFYTLTDTGRKMFAKIKETYAVQPIYRPVGDGPA